MDLQQFIQSVPYGQRNKVRQQLANRINRSLVAVKAYTSGARRVPPDLYEEIEQFTNYQVTVKDLVNMAKQAKADKTVNQ